MLDRFWQRSGIGYVALVFVFEGLGALLGGYATLLILYQYGESGWPPLDVVLAAEGGVIAGTSMAMALAWHDIKPAVAWIRGGRTADGAQEAWEATVKVLREVIVRGLVFVSVLTIPAELLATSDFDVGLSGVAIVFCAVQIGIALTGAWLIFAGEVLIRRPIRSAVLAGAQLELFRPRVRIGRRVVAAFAITTAFTTLLVGAIGSVGDSISTRLAGELALAAAITLTFTMVVTRAVIDSVVAPVRELIAGTERVAAGQLDKPVPLTSDDEFGVLAFSFNRMMDGLKEREALREHNAELVEELLASRARVVAAGDAERRRVERDLHDGAQQHLVLLNLKLGLTERTVGKDPAAVPAAFADLRAELAQALAELRDLAHGIYPAVLENDGLAAALSEAAGRAAIPTDVDCDGAGRYPRSVEAAVYFCCLEALQNASKHAGEGARATIELRARNGAFAFTVRDTGRGFEPAPAATSSGMQNMRDRIGSLGGTLDISSAPGHGTTVSGRIPLTPS